jgi:putative SOS response-associated peptidase YedK
MCGRANSSYTDDELSFPYLNRRPLKFGPIKPNYNMSPTHNAPTLRVKDGGREFNKIKWA